MSDREAGMNKFHESGLSLVELLVAMGVGLFIMSGVLVVTANSQQQFFQQEEVAYIQENARFAIDQISYDLRMAGYMGCSVKGELTNTLDSSSTDWYLSSTGIRGFEIGDAGFPSEISGTVAAGTDVVIINRAASDDSVQVSEHKPASATIDLTGPTTGMSEGDILMLLSPNCQNMAIFQMSGPNSSNPDHLNHGTGNGSPGNCHKALSGGYDCENPPANSVHGLKYPAGSSVTKFVSHAYFVRESASTGLPSLYRQTLVNNSGSVTTEAEEIASGIEDMEIVYGVDTDAVDPDGVVDRYYSADDITAEVATAGNSWVAWDRVLSARVTFIMRSSRELFSSPTAVDLGEGFTYNDKYLRQKISTTIRIRNRGLGVST